MDAVARRAVVAQHIQSHAADEGQVFGGMGLPGPAGILAELHVQDPVLLVFDAPVAAHDGGEPVPFWERAQEVAAFGAGFFPDDAGGLHPPDGLQSRPVRSRVEPVNRTAQRIAPNLNPALVFLDGCVALAEMVRFR